MNNRSTLKILLFPGSLFLLISLALTAHTMLISREVKQKGTTNIELPKAGKNDIIIHHTAYTLSFNETYHIANWTAYELTEPETHSVVKRSNHFVPDPLMNTRCGSNEDYKGSGYDRGHLAPAADMAYSNQTMTESFYLSNMAPQQPGFNRGIWKKLEDQVRDWAVENQSVYVVTGTVLTKGLPTIGYNRITVPHYFYKAILVYHHHAGKAIGFIMPNESSKKPLSAYAVTIDSIERMAGVDLYYQLPDDEEDTLESHIAPQKWNWQHEGK